MNAHAAFKIADPQLHAHHPFRPVQYLGSKLRALDEIRDAVRTLTSPGARIADLFTGSTVVAQSLALDGARVSALDTQQYAQVFASALLGVGRSTKEGISPQTIASQALAQLDQQTDTWRDLESEETGAIASSDAPRLRRLYNCLPLAWRSPSETAAPLSITNVYAGSYFGVRQAREIDAIRSAVHQMHRRGELSDWQASAALTGLMHAASLSVHSAGKHFAQPLKDGSGNTAFLDARLLADRSIQLMDRFQDGCNRVATTPFDNSDRHTAIRASAEDFTRSDKEHYDLYYLDPPYTAQQYSRFYHLLETLAGHEAPKLPIDSPISAGLYPPNRYKSAFSSRRNAPKAMEAILERISKNGSSALISYSASKPGSDGNARMITLEELLSICIRTFGTSNVECLNMPFRYRQFNSSRNSNETRDDSEILVLCKPA